VQFKAQPHLKVKCATTGRWHWNTTTRAGPWLVDLAHKTRWDLQDSKVGEKMPCELSVPAAGRMHLCQGETLVNRMNRTQASIYHLGTAAPGLPDFSSYTDVTESTVFWPCSAPTHFPWPKS
jgi:hypothetical protein